MAHLCFLIVLDLQKKLSFIDEVLFLTDNEDYAERTIFKKRGLSNK